jgi:raffinose/stachyose/melibiose transport system permease protein
MKDLERHLTFLHQKRYYLSCARNYRLPDINLALTNGGPGNSTLSMVLDIYNTGFLQNRLGYGSAKAVVLLTIIMIITFLQISATRKREVEL